MRVMKKINIGTEQGVLFCILVLLTGCVDDNSQQVRSLPYYSDASFTPRWFDSEQHVPNDFHRIPSFELIDQRGELITEKTFENKLYIANFFFTSCPGICPMTMNNMARLQAAFDQDSNVVLLSHSVTPRIDQVEVLEKFAGKMQALSEKWYLVTGEREQIYDLGKNFYFAEEDLGEITVAEEREAAFLHTESFLLIDQNRRIRGVYNGMNATAVSNLIDDVRILQSESNVGWFGASVADLF